MSLFDKLMHLLFEKYIYFEKKNNYIVQNKHFNIEIHSILLLLMHTKLIIPF